MELLRWLAVAADPDARVSEEPADGVLAVERLERPAVRGGGRAGGEERDAAGEHERDPKEAAVDPDGAVDEHGPTVRGAANRALTADSPPAHRARAALGAAPVRRPPTC